MIDSIQSLYNPQGEAPRNSLPMQSPDVRDECFASGSAAGCMPRADVPWLYTAEFSTMYPI
jgi:hypothetical protein